MSSCLGFGRKKRGDDHEPLLPQYQDDTILQRELHQKLHSYQMLRAIGNGYMPSTEQTIVHLRTLLAADILNPRDPNLSDSGRLLTKYTKQFLTQFIDLLQHKNKNEEIQDFLWYLSQSKVNVDINDLGRKAGNAKAKADTAAAYQSLQTVGSLLLTNSDFRVFLSDLNITAREVFKDAAFSLSNVAEDAGKKIDPSEEERRKVKEPGNDSGDAPPNQELAQDAAEVSQVVANGAAQVLKDTEQSAEEKLRGDEGQVMMNRLKQAISNLRQRNDYSDSVSVIGKLIQRYMKTYSRAAEDAASALDEDVMQNAEMDRTMKNFKSLVTSFGDEQAWKDLEKRWEQVMSHKDSDPQFENLASDLGNSVQKLLTDPDFLDHAPEKIRELREKSEKAGSESTLRKDCEALLLQIQVVINSVLKDNDISRLLQTSMHIFRILSPLHNTTNTDLIQDSINTFVPLLINAIQYIPIPRVEVSTPDIDLLLENLIVEPGKTVNGSSFLPYKLRVETYNDLEIRKARFRTTTTHSHLVTIKLDGISVRAEEIGFWMRAHSGILRLADEGIASFALDEKGLDIHLDVEIAKERLEQLVTLKAVRVNVHKLDYTMRKSKFSWLAWLVKPILRPIVRKVMEKQLASAIADALHSANRELLYARERLRATRISDPQDVMTFFRAISARLQPEEDPDLYTRIGVAQPGKGVFKGVYAPGSVVKLWNEEAAQAQERIDDGSEVRGWRNEIFDLHARSMG